ncbi:MAG TPA: aminotransferase class V-fold PLP-dependent enzyme [Gemmatimonadaceae bacterium]|nr:aminotransferase class V-fold PLP-dependent enzyme [Gemmatimonadaceae bacterium]
MLRPSFVRRDGRDVPVPNGAAGDIRRDASWFAALREREFARLDRSGEAYLDYTGSALYAESQVQRHLAFLTENILGNPHSQSVASLRSTEVIEDARRLTLEFFAADPAEYEVIFTANASGALRLVAEAFPFQRGSRFVLSSDNHNSVNGIREIARTRGAEVEYVRLDSDLRMESEERLLTPVGAPSLFAFPAQSNFSGVHHPLGLIPVAQRVGYSVLLDAAAFVPTNPLRLDVARPDFVAVSFYKMFGYPTGLGALIARRESLSALARPWFAGGTVEFVSIQHRTHMLKSGAEGFEDGTPAFGAIAALPGGFELLGEAGMPNVKQYVSHLTTMLLAELAAMYHTNGRPIVRVYGPADNCRRGGTVAFNVVDRFGRVVPYQRVERQALASGVSVRGGCFCNPGAAERAFGFPAAESAMCMDRARRDGFTVERFAECLGRNIAVGAVRASLGLASNEADIARLLDVVAQSC